MEALLMLVCCLKLCLVESVMYSSANFIAFFKLGLGFVSIYLSYKRTNAATDLAGRYRRYSFRASADPNILLYNNDSRENISEIN
jgi:hypothetical protein